MVSGREPGSRELVLSMVSEEQLTGRGVLLCWVAYLRSIAELLLF